MTDPQRRVTFGTDVRIGAGEWAMLAVTDGETGRALSATALYGGDLTDVTEFKVPAICGVGCKETFPSGATVSLTSTEIDVEQPIPCPACGADSYVPDDFTIEDTAGHRLPIRRLDLLRRAAEELLSSGLSNEELTALAGRLRAVTAAGPNADAVRAELGKDKRTKGLLPLTDGQRDLALLVQTIVAVIALVIALRTTGGASVDVNQVVVQAIEDKTLVESAPRSKVGRNEMCPCGSGTKFKRCHGR